MNPPEAPPPTSRRVAACALLAASLLAAPKVSAQQPPAQQPGEPAAQAQEAAVPPAQAPQAPGDECLRALGEGPRSSVCFDLGSRLYVSGGLGGVGFGIQVRRLTRTDEPGTTWRSEHGILRGITWMDRYRGALYEGRFMRHSREGYLLFPGNPPRRLPVPFDVGLETTALRVEGYRSQPDTRVNVVRGALLADFSRSDDFTRRLALGAVARWDATVRRSNRDVTEQSVAPFTVGYLGLYLESASGLTLASLGAEAGYATLGKQGFKRHISAELVVERVLLALNDHPVSLYGLGRYDDPGQGLRGEIGLRLALLGGSR